MRTHFHYFEAIRTKLFHRQVHEGKPDNAIEKRLAAFAKMTGEEVLSFFSTTQQGYTKDAFESALSRFGLNVVVREKRKPWIVRLFLTCINPLMLLLFAIAAIAVGTGDMKTAIVLLSMIVISVGIRFYQENQAYSSAESLRAMVHTVSVVIRGGIKKEVRLEEIVPGDIVSLTAGAIVPADVRILVSKDLTANQSLLTGEALPVEKHAMLSKDTDMTNPLNLVNMCFMGSNIESGTALAIAVTTGSDTYFGSLAKDVVGEREVTDFDRGINRFTWLMLGFMAVLVPVVFVINGLSKHDWSGAFLFAISVAVGLTPEMLPAIVAVNLTSGSIEMSKKKVIVKRLSAIQNFGAMNVLCSDKTGTLTRNEVVLVKSIDFRNEESALVLESAYLNSNFQTGFRNLIDGAVIKHADEHQVTGIKSMYEKIDEIPFDFSRRRLSVVVGNTYGGQTLHTKGAVEEVIPLCTHISDKGISRPISIQDRDALFTLEHSLNLDGFQVVAVASRAITQAKKSYAVSDERDLVFLGFMAFFDPPKETAGEAILALEKFGVAVKILTGDNEYVTRKVCRDVGLEEEGVLLGNAIAKMSDEDLAHAAAKTTIFAKLLPDHKRRVVKALQAGGGVVGFLGDGINDAPALRTADVGISVNSAVDIAKESADIILLEMNLMVLADGVKEGRRVFGNITKYIKMGASSNFGNMFSVLGASLLLPFLPMTPIQILTNNLLYDFSQTTIPTDKVDAEYMTKPRKWQIGDIGRYMLFIGPVSSLFDYLTFGLMWFVFHGRTNAALFQTGWFIESLITQTIIIHVIRSRKIPFLQTHASSALMISTTIVIASGIALIYLPFGKNLGFAHLPLHFWPILFLMMISYMTLTHIVKTWYINKFGYN